MLLSKQKKSQAAKGNRFLISVTVLGSAGPIRFLVSEDELVGAVIDIALKSYAREGRLPVLGSDTDDFILYCPIAGSEALLQWETIGWSGVRNFVLCKRSRGRMSPRLCGPGTGRRPELGFGRLGSPNLAASRYLFIRIGFVQYLESIFVLAKVSNQNTRVE